MKSWQFLEMVVIGGVILWQITHTIKMTSKIFNLKNIFTERLSVEMYYYNDDDDELDGNEESGVEIALVETKGKGKEINKIKDAINQYLTNNFGAAVNFSIIKDIVDREVDVQDEKITQSITLPLYLGLAATMVGIIFGLFSMPSLDSDGFSVGINALIGGVKIAMIGSLVGLACTTFLSIGRYGSAKQKMQQDKNEQLSYLQAELLPELVKAEDTGVSGLKASLDRFARVATDISDNVLFSAQQTGVNLRAQQEFLDKVERMDVQKISKRNLELFEKLDANMAIYSQFSQYLTKMEQISSQLHDFASRTSDVSRVVNSIDNSLEESKQLTRFLTSHFSKIEDAGGFALKAVGVAESHFEEAVNELKERTDEMMNNLYKNSGSHESKLEDIYQNLENSITEITVQYVNSFRDAYENSVPKFDMLASLEPILDACLKNMEMNQEVVKRLTAIEERVQKRGVGNTNPSVSLQRQESIPQTVMPMEDKDEDKDLSVGKLLNKLKWW